MIIFHSSREKTTKKKSITKKLQMWSSTSAASKMELVVAVGNGYVKEFKF